MKFYFVTLHVEKRFLVKDLNEAFNIVQHLALKYGWPNTLGYDVMTLEQFNTKILNEEIGELYDGYVLWWLNTDKEYQDAISLSSNYKINKQIDNYIGEL